VEGENTLPNGAEEAPILVAYFPLQQLISEQNFHYWQLIYTFLGTKCQGQNFKITLPLH